MQLIKKIEVNYLRSLYGAVLDKVGDLNVIFGRNDSGKSNLLRALNLFFNSDTDVGRKLDFDLDMSDRRRQEARDAKGRQFIWIKITFSLPENYRGALGSEIAIKRQWNRDGLMTQTEFPPVEGTGKRARLTRFLNDIDFNYIPAVKDLEVYADLIERMYGAAAETAALQNATTDFVAAIEAQTADLSVQLAQLFGTEARLAPPTEMSRLFRNLDFAHGEGGHSLLRQKGDGVKARHLPELLRFINEKEVRKKLYIWGFEEPENSLDLQAAESEADRFASFGAREDTQVFITSHSPAFYLSQHDEEANVRRYFITKQEPNEDGVMSPKNAAARIDRLDEAEIRMASAGLMRLPFVIRQLDEQRSLITKKEEELTALTEEATMLRRELNELQRPSIFVEGRHDIGPLESALERLGQADEISVRALGGTPSNDSAYFEAVLRQGGITPGARTLFLFDNDHAGRSSFRKLCKVAPDGSPQPIGEQAFGWLLPLTDEFLRFLNKQEIKQENAFFTAEFLYPAEAASELCLEITQGNDQGVSIEEWRTCIHGNYHKSLPQMKSRRLSEAAPGTVDWFFARGVPENRKAQFAKLCVERNLDTQAIDTMVDQIVQTLLD